MRPFHEATDEERAAFARQAARQVDNLEKAIGRSLTEDEGEKLADELIIRYEHNEPLNGLRAWWNVSERPDLDTPAGRTEYTRARLAFDEADSAPDAEVFDTDTPEGRLKYAVARFEGAPEAPIPAELGLAPEVRGVIHRPHERAATDGE